MNASSSALPGSTMNVDRGRSSSAALKPRRRAAGFFLPTPGMGAKLDRGRQKLDHAERSSCFAQSAAGECVVRLGLGALQCASACCLGLRSVGQRGNDGVQPSRRSSKISSKKGGVFCRSGAVFPTEAGMYAGPIAAHV
jgi:hypothetical protein